MCARGWAVAVALGVGILSSASCKKTVEGESKAWTRNLQRTQELGALYPGFAGALREQTQKAQAAMNAAKGGSEKESAQKMAEANSLLNEGFVYTLGQVDSKMKTLREKIITASTAAESSSDQAGAKAAADDAQRVLHGVDDQLKTGAADAASAAVVVRKIDGDLTSATANVDHVIDATKKRKEEAAKVAGAAGGAAGAAGATAPVAKVTWKCSYCNHVNDDSMKKCPNCGAPRPAPKDPAAAKPKGKTK